MSKVVAIISVSLDGYIADPNDGVAEVFDWYFNSGDVEFHAGGSDAIQHHFVGQTQAPSYVSRGYVVSHANLLLGSPS